MISIARGVNCKKKQLLPLKPGMLHSKAIEIRTHEDKSIWSLFRTYINSMEVNSIFNRTQMLSSVYIHEVVVGGMTSSQTTVDQYKRYLIIAKVLEPISRGVYKKLKNIPEDLSISKLKNHVYGDSWKIWFIEIEDL